MERTVPTTASEEIELYMRTYYSLLRSTAEVRIRSFEEAHNGMNSLLHLHASAPQIDTSALIYSLLRLPTCLPRVKLVVLGQSDEVFARAGYGTLTTWEEVVAVARRRRCYFDGREVLACFIASRSDIDDIIPMLTALQIEWNKLHIRLRRIASGVDFDELCESSSGYSRLAELIDVPIEDFDRLYAIWGEDFGCNMHLIASAPMDLRVRLLSGSLNEYRRARHAWWENIEANAPHVRSRPIYFVSSNVHSLRNLLSGFALKNEALLIQYLENSGNVGLQNEWKDILQGRVPSSRENFLYYLLRKYQQTQEGQTSLKAQSRLEKTLGITRISSMHSFDVEAQVIELSRLDYESIDPRLKNAADYSSLKVSDALIFNIDYPLGVAAYDILTEVASHVSTVLGVYIMGKAATLNAVVGDVMIPNVVHDEHSKNTYLFENCFSAADISSHLVYGTVLDNQKAMSVMGTFLQNARYMDVFYREGYTDIEMESGPYLSAIYEMYRPKRHPIDEIVNLYGLPFDVGIIHYASDTPLSKGRNLGAGSLSYYGMDSTYAVALAVLRRIFDLELDRIQGTRNPRGK